MPRPSSPVIAKASITCTLSLDPITVDPVLQNPPLRACLRQLRRAPFVSRREARYNSTLRIQSLISSKCALPSRIVKEQRTAFSSGFAQNPELNAVVNAIDRSRQHGSKHQAARGKLASRDAPCRYLPPRSPIPATGGADRDRTDDPLLAKQVLSQLSYSPGVRYQWSRFAMHP